MMGHDIKIKGYSSFADADDFEQVLEVKFHLFVSASDCATVTDKFLKDLQTFLDERK